MASAELSRRVEEVVGYQSLCDMDERQRREFHEALLDADSFDDLPGKWQAAILKARHRGDGGRRLRAALDPRRAPHVRELDDAAGVNAKALSEFMGHATIAITFDLYGHMLPGANDEAAGLLDAFLARSAQTETDAAIAARTAAYPAETRSQSGPVHTIQI
jgi:integrase